MKLLFNQEFVLKFKTYNFNNWYLTINIRVCTYNQISNYLSPNNLKIIIYM
jgi:hypothetical protein